MLTNMFIQDAHAWIPPVVWEGIELRDIYTTDHVTSFYLLPVEHTPPVFMHVVRGGDSYEGLVLVQIKVGRHFMYEEWGKIADLYDRIQALRDAIQGVEDMRDVEIEGWTKITSSFQVTEVTEPPEDNFWGSETNQVQVTRRPDHEELCNIISENISTYLTNSVIGRPLNDTEVVTGIERCISHVLCGYPSPRINLEDQGRAADGSRRLDVTVTVNRFIAGGEIKMQVKLEP